tara:strand:+ start:19680 stop:20930 length:1251 start_codon:yes stop_codon:yes gene_type:complete
MAKPTLPHELNICIISRKFPLSGRAADHSYLLYIAKGLVKRGHHVTVLAHSNQVGKSLEEQEGIKAYYLNQNQLVPEDKYADLVKERFAKLHREKPFHMVHCIDNSGAKVLKYKKHYQVTTMMDVEATRMGEVISILGMSQETPWGAIRTALSVTYKFLRTYFSTDRALLKKADGVIVTSPQQRIALERYYLYPDRRIFTISYGLQVSENINEENAQAIRKKLEIREDDFCIITFSDMLEINEITTIIKAFEQLVIKKPNSRLVIVGKGPRYKDIEFMVLNHALGSKVVMTGAIKNTEIPDYISTCNVYINLSSRTSGFESSLLESMAQQKIVIGSEVSALSSLIENGIDGFLIRPADIEGLFQLFMDIMNKQIAVEEMQVHAYKKVMNFSDPQKMTDDCVNAYFDILRLSGKYKR